MKYPFVFLIVAVLLPAIIFVMLTSMLMTELETLLHRKREPGC